MTIIVTPPGKQAIHLNRSQFTQESDLQKYLQVNPQAIPISDLKEGGKLIVIERESPTPAGRIDLLAADQDGELYIIETKLYRNQDKRQVLAQTLDYGAALWSLADDPDEWLEQLEERLGPGKLDTLFETEFQDSESARSGIRSSLQNGVYHFLILMDMVPPDLKTLIQYINENSRFKVYAVELEYYKHEDYQILIPHLFGAVYRTSQKIYQHGLRRSWDEGTFFAQANEKLSVEKVRAIRAIYDAARSITDNVSFGNGKDTASFNPKVESISARSLFTIKSNGVLYLNYVWLDDNDYALECQRLYIKKLKTIPPFKDAIENSTKKYPSLQIEKWMGYTNEIIQMLKAFVKECEELPIES